MKLLRNKLVPKHYTLFGGSLKSMSFLCTYNTFMILCYLYFIHAGICYSYFLHQLPLWAIFYMALLFWAVISPFHYQSFKNAGHLKYVYTAMIIVGVLLPCVSAGVNFGFGIGILSFSPMVCVVAVQDVGFYTDGLFQGFEVAILGTLQAFVFLMLLKVGHCYSLILVIVSFPDLQYHAYTAPGNEFNA